MVTCNNTFYLIIYNIHINIVVRDICYWTPLAPVSLESLLQYYYLLNLINVKHLCTCFRCPYDLCCLTIIIDTTNINSDTQRFLIPLKCAASSLINSPCVLSNACAVSLHLFRALQTSAIRLLLFPALF